MAHLYYGHKYWSDHKSDDSNNSLYYVYVKLALEADLYKTTILLFLCTLSSTIKQVNLIIAIF